MIELITPPPEEKPFICCYCDLGYSSKANLQLHLMNKKRFFKCYVKHKEAELARNNLQPVGKVRDENDQDEPLPKKHKKNRASSSLLEAFKMKTDK